MVSSNYTADMEDSSNMVLITIHLLIILLPILLKKALRQIQKMVLHSLRGKWDVHESLHHEVVTLYTIHMVLYSYFDQIDNYSICYPSFLQKIYIFLMYSMQVSIFRMGRLLRYKPNVQITIVIILSGIWELAFRMLNRDPFCCRERF